MSVDAGGRTNSPFPASDLAGVSAAEVAAALDLILASDVFAISRTAQPLPSPPGGSLAGVAASSDPVNTEVCYREGRIPNAILVSTKAVELYPDQIMLQLLLNLSYIQDGQTDRGSRIRARLEARYPAARLFEVMALGRSGHTAGRDTTEEGLCRIPQLETE